MEEYFSDILVYETSAGVVLKEDIKVGGKGVREDVVYRDTTTSSHTCSNLEVDGVDIILCLYRNAMLSFDFSFAHPCR